MRTHPLHSLLAALTACFTLASCDLLDKDEKVACAGDDCADKKDPKDPDDEEDDGEEEGEEEEDEGESMPEEGGENPPPPVPEECEVLCACVADLGASEHSCGQQCGGDLNDDDPNDRQQCIDGLAEAGYSECAPDCDTFSDGS